MMVVHIPADRKSAYVVSVPRDSYVPIYDAEGIKHGKNKINEAFSQYGPFGTLRTVENLGDLRIDHMAVIDFEGFHDLTTAVGGVDVYVPEAFYDSKQKVEWEQGTEPPRGRPRPSSTSAPATAWPTATSTASTASRTSCAPSWARSWRTAPSATR